MNKFTFFILTIIIGLLYIFHFDKYLAEQFVVINNLKKSYIEKTSTIISYTETFFNQSSKIKHLSEENKELKKYQNLYVSAKNELANVKDSISSLNLEFEDISLAHVLSYVNFNDFTKIWLDVSKNDNQIQGLISEDYSAGIVIQKANKAQALLNGNEKCNYAVFIGENKAPGIIHKNAHKELLTVKYIPIWIDIKLDDEVITSGMDDIFFEGLKVGKVVKINKMADQQEAFIKPYAKVLQQKHFYIYDNKVKNKELSKTP